MVLGKKTENVQPLVQESHSKQAMLSIAHFVEVRSRSEIKIGGLLKAEVALAKIALALPWIERNLHASKYTANPVQDCAPSDPQVLKERVSRLEALSLALIR